MNKRFLLKAVFALLTLILVLGIVYSGLRILESTVFSAQDREFKVQTKTVIRDGQRYYPRQDINVILLMGINQRGPVQASSEMNSGGACDMVALVVFDEKNETVTVVNVNRDLMLDMPALDDQGQEAGSFYGQLAYAHTYGTGMEDSCENTRKAVANFFGGIHIDYYISMNLDAIGLVNDAVGGVPVYNTYDFSQVSQEIPLGDVTLMGEQARIYVQTRWNVGDELNLSRIERQKAYMDSFASVFRQKIKTADTGFVLDTYEQVAPYLVSDLPVSTLTGMVERYLDYPLAGVLSLEGENRLGEEFYEFYADSEKLEQLVVDVFYAPKG